MCGLKLYILQLVELAIRLIVRRTMTVDEPVRIAPFDDHYKLRYKPLRALGLSVQRIQEGSEDNPDTSHATVQGPSCQSGEVSTKTLQALCFETRKAFRCCRRLGVLCMLSIMHAQSEALAQP